MKVSVPPVCGFSPPASDAAGAEDDVVGAACWVHAASVRARTTANAMLLRGKRDHPLGRLSGAATLARTNGEGSGFSGRRAPLDYLLVHVHQLSRDVRPVEIG